MLLETKMMNWLIKNDPTLMLYLYFCPNGMGV